MDIQDVENLTELAKLELSEEEKKEILKDMESILKYVEQIEEVKLPTGAAEQKLYNVWREDEEEKEPRDFSADLIIEQFPASQDGFLKVKKIL